MSSSIPPSSSPSPVAGKRQRDDDDDIEQQDLQPQQPTKKAKVVVPPPVLSTSSSSSLSASSLPPAGAAKRQYDEQQHNDDDDAPPPTKKAKVSTTAATSMASSVVVAASSVLTTTTATTMVPASSWAPPVSSARLRVPWYLASWASVPTVPTHVFFDNVMPCNVVTTPVLNNQQQRSFINQKCTELCNKIDEKFLQLLMSRRDGENDIDEEEEFRLPASRQSLSLRQKYYIWSRCKIILVIKDMIKDTIQDKQRRNAVSTAAMEVYHRKALTSLCEEGVSIPPLPCEDDDDSIRSSRHAFDENVLKPRVEELKFAAIAAAISNNQLWDLVFHSSKFIGPMNAADAAAFAAGSIGPLHRRHVITLPTTSKFVNEKKKVFETDNDGGSSMPQYLVNDLIPQSVVNDILNSTIPPPADDDDDNNFITFQNIETENPRFLLKCTMEFVRQVMVVHQQKVSSTTDATEKMIGAIAAAKKQLNEFVYSSTHQQEEEEVALDDNDDDDDSFYKSVKDSINAVVKYPIYRRHDVDRVFFSDDYENAPIWWYVIQYHSGNYRSTT